MQTKDEYIEQCLIMIGTLINHYRTFSPNVPQDQQMWTYADDELLHNAEKFRDESYLRRWKKLED